ncbi:MAG: HAD-IA family hydrolase [Chthoniobacterales bacterium]
MIKAISFDAGNTLIRLTKSVGQNYALIGQRQGLELDPDAVDRVFGQLWREAPVRPATEGGPRPGDDKGWWRELVDRLLDQVSARIDAPARDRFFEAAYGLFAESGVWALYPEVREVLEALAPRYELMVISNFDGRLRHIFGHLSISQYFRHIFLSSELGADKPNPLIYRRALESSGFVPYEVLHVGDDPVRDATGATKAGLAVFQLDRPYNSLRDLLRL